MVMSKRQAERCIRDGGVTVAGQQVMSPSFLLNWKDATCSVKVDGKLLQIQQSPRETRVWLVHKLPGEVVSERDPHGRPSLLERLHQSIPSHHLKPVGRLDIMTEGLIIMTNNGALARDLELPKNKVHRTYRVRVHGKLTPYKLKAMRSGITIGNIRYNGMKVEIENTRKKGTSTNTWLRITCTQGKNRQIRNVLAHLAMNVTRLIRISYGDYQLQTIPPGMAIEVPVKTLEQHRNVGSLTQPRKNKVKLKEEPLSTAAPVQWVRHL
jgi:23S rRNA pseudouridine2605 synthase